VRRSAAGALVVSVVLGALLVPVVPPAPAEAAAPCEVDPTTGFCIGAGTSNDTDPSSPTPVPSGPHGAESSTGGEQTSCPPRQWVTIGNPDSIPPHLQPASWDDAPSDAVIQYDQCTCPTHWDASCLNRATRWIVPGGDQVTPPLLPSPDEVASDAWAEIRVTLKRPEVRTYPPANMPSVVGIPTFVSVSNWQDTIEAQRCDPTGAVCVAITAEPTLTWNPGEPDAPTIPCEAGGTPYDPDGPSPHEQAARRGACAYVYGQRTGVNGHPDAWDGVVTVLWTARWETTIGAARDSGSFGALSLSTGVPRSVVEVTSVVVDA
jgi:hypothetical protein